MDYIQKITEDLKIAVKEKNQRKIEALRSLKSELLLLKTSGKGEIKQEDFIQLITKMIKQRKDTAELYKSKGREELAQKELEQAKYLETYLPKQLTEAELETELRKIIEEVEAKSMKDMGKVMSVATKRLMGKAENKKIAEVVKKLLNQ